MKILEAFFMLFGAAVLLMIVLPYEIARDVAIRIRNNRRN